MGRTTNKLFLCPHIFVMPFCVGVGGEDVMEVFWGNLVHNRVGGNCSAEFFPVRQGSPSKF